MPTVSPATASAAALGTNTPSNNACANTAANTVAATEPRRCAGLRVCTPTTVDRFGVRLRVICLVSHQTPIRVKHNQNYTSVPQFTEISFCRPSAAGETTTED